MQQSFYEWRANFNYYPLISAQRVTTLTSCSSTMALHKCTFYNFINQSFQTPPLTTLCHTVAMKKLFWIRQQSGTVINDIVIRHTHLSSIIDHIISFTVTMLSSSSAQSTTHTYTIDAMPAQIETENVPALLFCTHAWVNRVQIVVFIYPKE